MSATAENGTQGSTVKARLRSDRDLAFTLTEFTNDHAYYAARYPAGYACNVVAVVIGRSGIFHHIHRYGRYNDRIVLVELKSRAYLSLEDDPGPRHLTEQVKVECLHRSSV